MIELVYTTRTSCRVCGSTDLAPLFSLGEQFVSDFVEQPWETCDKCFGTGKNPDDDYNRCAWCQGSRHLGPVGTKCPIDIELCRNCSLVQSKHTAPQDFLYTRFYWFRSGVTQTMRDALRDVTEAAERLVSLRPGDVVLDIGSNDSTLLRSYIAPGIVRVGVEPANNLAEEGRIGVDCLIREFWAYHHYLCATHFSRQTMRWERLPKAKVITACGMAYDLEDPNQFVADIAKALAPDGVCIWQLMCLRNMLNVGDVGNVCHEHLEYYSLRSLQYLFGKHGLTITDIETNAVNGESYRVIAKHEEAITVEDTERRADKLRPMQRSEETDGLADPAFYADWFAQVQANRDSCVSFLREQHANGERIHLLGASTKGNVILQFYGLDHTVIEAASERSPEKVGLFTIGTGIPIVSEEQSRAMKPDLYLVLPYAFRSEMLEREREFRERGGRFVFALPLFEVV